MIFNGCAAFLSRLFPSRVRTRRALRWWHRRQADRLHEGAELIRDGILQDLFAIRRMLELSHDEHEPASESDLRQLEVLHHKLELLSNTLSPPFIQDSLSLALQHRLKQWRVEHPDILVSLKLPNDTDYAQASQPQPSDSSSRVALMTFEELLALVAQHLSSEASLELELTPPPNMTLMVRVMEPNPQQRRAIANLQDLVHLHRAFQFLTEGRSKQFIRGSWIEWQFSWSTDQ